MTQLTYFYERSFSFVRTLLSTSSSVSRCVLNTLCILLYNHTLKATSLFVVDAFKVQASGPYNNIEKIPHFISLPGFQIYIILTKNELVLQKAKSSQGQSPVSQIVSLHLRINNSMVIDWTTYSS